MSLFLKSAIQESVNSYLLSAYHVPDTVLGTGDPAENKRVTPLLSRNMHFNGGDGEDGQ